MTEHELSYVIDGMLDQCVCSCGWKSNTYFDDQRAAFSEWKAHADSTRLAIEAQRLYKRTRERYPETLARLSEQEAINKPEEKYVEKILEAMIEVAARLRQVNERRQALMKESADLSDLQNALWDESSQLKEQLNKFIEQQVIERGL